MATHAGLCCRSNLEWRKKPMGSEVQERIVSTRQTGTRKLHGLVGKGTPYIIDNSNTNSKEKRKEKKERKKRSTMQPMTAQRQLLRCCKARLGGAKNDIIIRP